MIPQRLPDFLIIGAMKSGTTTLQAQLAAQAGVFMTTPKEPNFFSDDPIYAQGLDWYQALFDPAGPADIKGEASTHYTKLPTYPETVARLAAAVSAPRLIYVIRDPIERALSHYLHAWSVGDAGRDVAAAFAAHPEFVSYSRYPMQLAPFQEAFGKDSILLTSLEQIKARPAHELARVAQHIGLIGPVTWDETLGAQNVSAERVRPLPLHRVLVDNPVARRLRHLLVPKAVRTRIRLARTRQDRPTMPDPLRLQIEQICAPDYDALAAAFPAFAGLELSYPFVTR